MTTCSLAVDDFYVDMTAAPYGCFVDTSGGQKVCANRYPSCSAIQGADMAKCVLRDSAKSGWCYVDHDSKCAQGHELCSQVPPKDCKNTLAVSKATDESGCFLNETDPTNPVCERRYIACVSIPKADLTKCALPGIVEKEKCYRSQTYEGCWEVHEKCKDAPWKDCKDPAAVKPGLKCFVVGKISDTTKKCVAVGGLLVDDCNLLSNKTDCENYQALVKGDAANRGCLWAKSNMAGASEPKCWTKANACDDLSYKNKPGKNKDEQKEHCWVPGITPAVCTWSESANGTCL